MSEPVDGNCNVKICGECGVNIYALPGLRHAQAEYSRLADYVIPKKHMWTGQEGSHTDSVIREIDKLSAEHGEMNVHCVKLEKENERISAEIGQGQRDKEILLVAMNEIARGKWTAAKERAIRAIEELAVPVADAQAVIHDASCLD